MAWIGLKSVLNDTPVLCERKGKDNLYHRKSITKGNYVNHQNGVWQGSERHSQHWHFDVYSCALASVACSIINQNDIFLFFFPSLCSTMEGPLFPTTCRIQTGDMSKLTLWRERSV